MYRPIAKPVSYIKSFKTTVRVGIVGSRKYTNKWLVKMLVKELPRWVVVVSGYGGIVDRTAVDTARELHVKYVEHRPDWVYRKRGGGLVRNKLIAKDDLCCLVAFIDTDRSTGTLKTIKYALKEKVKVFVIKSNASSTWPAGRRQRCITLKNIKTKKRKKCIISKDSFDKEL